MGFDSLSRFPTGSVDRSHDCGPLPDRHSASFAVGVVLAVGVAALFVIIGFALMLMLVGVPLPQLA